MTPHLTKKETEALALIRQGERFKRAAFHLNITERALKARLAGVRCKLDAKTTTHAVAEAMAQGLLE